MCALLKGITMLHFIFKTFNIRFGDHVKFTSKAVATKNRSQVCSDQFMDSRGKMINANNKMQLTL